MDEMTTTAVLPIASCGRCGAAFRARLAKCGTCGAPDIPVLPEVVTTDGAVPALSGAASVERGPQRAALAIDLLPIVLVLVAAIVVAAVGSSTSPLVVGVLAAALIAGLHASMLTSRGRSIGRLLLRQRTVDDLTGLPPAPLVAVGLVFGRRVGTATVDLRGGRDPLEPTAASFGAGALRSSLEGGTQAAVVASSPVGEQHATAVAIVLDSGQRLVIERSLVLGRNPRSDGRHPVHVWPDLSRSISKRHVLLEWSGSELWVTDLDSSNGTRLVSPSGQRQELVAGRRAAAHIGTRVVLGERSILVAEAVER
jgi:hypothetical protein